MGNRLAGACAVPETLVQLFRAAEQQSVARPCCGLYEDTWVAMEGLKMLRQRPAGAGGSSGRLRQTRPDFYYFLEAPRFFPPPGGASLFFPPWRRLAAPLPVQPAELVLIS